MMTRAWHMVLATAILWSSCRVHAQCTNYSITVTGGAYPYEVSWQLADPGGGLVASGGAPASMTVCLEPGCYTMYMYDTFGDGWNGADFTIRELPANTVVSTGTLSLAGGYSGTATVSIGGGCEPPGCTGYQFQVTGGAYPEEVSWNLIGGASVLASGFAPSTQTICLLPGCYVVQLFDSFGDGWNGATWSLRTAGGTIIQSGTLATGSIGQAIVAIGVPVGDCGSVGPVVASDCVDAVNVCTNISFAIDPNGYGAVNEIPPLGSLGNPDYGDFSLVPPYYNPWGTFNEGCLRNNELNSTWMVVNIWGSGSLEFTFGGLGSQAGFYDWIMYPYDPSTCAAVSSNTVAPVRCNWNGVSFGGTGLAATVPIGGDVSNYEPPLAVLAGQQYLICFSNWSSVTTNVPLQFGGTAIVDCQDVTLPITLVAFNAEAGAGDVLVEWSTATEANSDRFEVERTTDQHSWDVIGVVPAAGSSNTLRAYRFTDEAPWSGTSYYRLRMVDVDGSFTYSPVRAVERRAGSCHPNPNSGSFTLTTSGRPDDVSIIDTQGRQVPFQATRHGPDQLTVELPPALPHGLYIVRMGVYGAAERVMVGP